jgi:hypothetical protein
VLECRRVLTRALALDLLTPAETANARRLMTRAARRWATVDVSAAVVDRAAAAFPREPVRSLDALHLASALLLLDEGDDVTVLSLDVRVRENARLLGLAVVPEDAPPPA